MTAPRPPFPTAPPRPMNGSATAPPPPTIEPDSLEVTLTTKAIREFWEAQATHQATEDQVYRQDAPGVSELSHRLEEFSAVGYGYLETAHKRLLDVMQAWDSKRAGNLRNGPPRYKAIIHEGVIYVDARDPHEGEDAEPLVVAVRLADEVIDLGCLRAGSKANGNGKA